MPVCLNCSGEIVVVVEDAGCEVVLGLRTSPDSVNAVLRGAVERTVTVALVEHDEQRRPLRLEGVTVQNIGHEATYIVVTVCCACGVFGRCEDVLACAGPLHI